MTRRQEYAEATRQAIVAAARKLFAERGYFATRVEDIAIQARVAPATVYAVTGGKSGLLAELIRIWTSDPIVEATLSSISSARSGAAIIAEVAAVSRRMREDFADIMRVLLATAPHDQAVMQQLRNATAVYRGAFEPVAERLAELGALREGLDVGHAVDVLWFYFGYASYFTLLDDNGWSYERAERWLAEQAARELLVPAHRRAMRSHQPQPGDISSGSSQAWRGRRPTQARKSQLEIAPKGSSAEDPIVATRADGL